MQTSSKSFSTLLFPVLLAACSAGSTTQEAHPATNKDTAAIPAAQAQNTGVDTKTTVQKPRGKDDVKMRLLSLFSAREQKNTQKDLLALGSADDVEMALLDIAMDETAKLQHRLAATGSLRWFHSTLTRSTLEDAITNPSGNIALRRSAVAAYGAAFVDIAVPVLEKAAANDDLHTRIQALQALHDVGSPAARAVVESRMSVEKEDAVRLAGKSALDTWK